MEIIATMRRDKDRFDDFSHFANKIKELQELGVKTFRFNLSKFSKADLPIFINDIKYLKKEYPTSVVILDLPYPGNKCRMIIKDRKTIHLEKNDIVTFNVSEQIVLDEDTVYFSHSLIDLDFSKIARYICGDGNAILQYKEFKYPNLYLAACDKCDIEHGKAINFVGSIKTEDDINKYWPVIKEITPDYLALSFIENKDQILCIKNNMKGLENIKIISKIETHLGFQNLPEIAAISDSIMLSRGDLGLQVELEDFFIIQEKIIDYCKKNNCEIIVATDIMNSMMDRKVPARADLIDMQYLITKGIDAMVLTYGLVRTDNMLDVVHMINDSFRKLKDVSRT